MSGSNGETNHFTEFILKDKINKAQNRLAFLLDCLHEQVLPRSAPKQLKKNTHPFPESARAYLEDAVRSLQDHRNVLQSRLAGVHLPHHMVEMLRQQDATHRAHLQALVTQLCEESPWRKVGNRDLITNLSNRDLSGIETEALSLGMKFAVGCDKQPLVETIMKNYRYTDSDIDKGFIQGLAASCAALSKHAKRSMPRRYLRALKDLAKDESIIVTTADKGGGVVIMDYAGYKKKMFDLLNDASTYKKMAKGSAEKDGKRFNQRARRILNSSSEGKRLLHLLEEKPVTPSMYGLPKTHKSGNPMRPITSGVKSAPHRLAKKLAKPLSDLLGTISGTHLRNSGDLINRLKGESMTNKKLASFDVKSLFTNVPLQGAMEAVKRALDKNPTVTLPVPKADFVSLVQLCVEFGALEFDGCEFKQIDGLAMGSPLSPVLACLFVETLEADHYLNIVGQNATWLRYVDDVFVIVDKQQDLDRILQELNRVHSKIQFTCEEEQEGKLPFLDTLIWNRDSRLKFSVYRKPTNKNDFIHFYSSHSLRTKTGVVLGFFLRAFRISSKEFLRDELEYIRKVFTKLGYPLGLLLKLEKKAIKIRSRSSATNAKRKVYVSVPMSASTDTINNFTKDTLNVTSPSGSTIKDILRRKKRTNNQDSVVYRIPCGGCGKSYIGETYRGAAKRAEEHKRDLRNHQESNAIVQHVDDEGHLPNWSGMSNLCVGLNKQNRQAAEAAFISTMSNFNGNSGKVKLSRYTAQLILKTDFRK